MLFDIIALAYILTPVAIEACTYTDIKGDRDAVNNLRVFGVRIASWPYTKR